MLHGRNRDSDRRRHRRCGRKGTDELRPCADEILGTTDYELEEAGKFGDITYFIAQDPNETTGRLSDLEKNMEPEFFEEYKKLIESKQDFIDSLIFVEPEAPVVLNIGDTISFEAAYMNGEPVKSEGHHDKYPGVQLPRLHA